MTNLEKRIKEYGIPGIPYLPQYKTVLVYRLPERKVSAGGIHLLTGDGGEGHAEARGVLLSAGLKARDSMHDALIEVGDIVWVARFAGWEKEVSRDPENVGKKILQVKIEDINGSVDGVERAKDYDIVRDPDTGEHFYQKKSNTKRKAA